MINNRKNNLNYFFTKEANILLVSIFLLLSNFLFAQPANDDFTNAIDVTTLINSCSADDAYSTVNATADGNAGSEWNGGVVDNNV